MSSFMEELNTRSPSKQRYTLRWLPRYLAKFGEFGTLYRLLTTFDFLQAKIEQFDPQTLILDYDLSKQFNEDSLAETSLTDMDNDLHIIQMALMLSSHLLDKNTSQLAGQLHGRLLGFNSITIETLLREAETYASTHANFLPSEQILMPPGGQLKRTLSTQKSISAFASTPDGHHIMLALHNVIEVWNLQVWERLFVLEGHETRVNVVIISNDGHYAVSASEPQLWSYPDSHTKVWSNEPSKVVIWDLREGKVIHTLVEHTEPSKKWEHLTFENFVEDFQSAKHMHFMEKVHNFQLMKAEKATIKLLALSSHGDYLLSYSDGNILKVWDLYARKALHTYNDLLVNSLIITPDDRLVVAHLTEGSLKVWDLVTGEDKGFFKVNNTEIVSFSITSDSCYLVARLTNQTLKVWKLQERIEIITVLLNDKEGQQKENEVSESSAFQEIRSIAKTSDIFEGKIATLSDEGVYVTHDEYLIVAKQSNSWGIWDLKSGALLKYLASDSEAARILGLHYAFSYPNHSELLVWDITKHETQWPIKTVGHNDIVSAIAVTSDEHYAISASYDRTLKVWDLQTREHVHSLKGHRAGVTCVTTTTDNRYAISGSLDGTLRIWDLVLGLEDRLLRGHKDRIIAVDITPDGRFLVSASLDGTIKIWIMPKGKVKRTIKAHNTEIKAVTISPCGRFIISGAGSTDSYNNLSGAEFWSKGGHNLFLTSCALKVWELQTGRLLNTLEYHTSDITAIEMTPNGRYVISSSSFDGIAIWNFQTGELAAIDNSLRAWDLKSVSDKHFIATTTGELCLVHFLDEEIFEVIAAFDKEGVYSCAVARENSTVLVGGFDGQMLFFKLLGLVHSYGE